MWLDSKLSVDEKKQRDREERESLVLWKKPLLTLHYFTLELLVTLQEWIWRWDHGWDTTSRQKILLISAMVVMLLFSGKKESMFVYKSPALAPSPSQAHRSKSTHITWMVTLIFLVLSPIEAFSLIVFGKKSKTKQRIFLSLLPSLFLILTVSWHNFLPTGWWYLFYNATSDQTQFVLMTPPCRLA